MLNRVMITSLIFCAGIAPITANIAVKTFVDKSSELAILYLQVRYAPGRYKLTNIEIVLKVILLSLPPAYFLRSSTV